VVGAVCNAASSVAGKAAGFGVDAVFAAAGRWVSSGAVWLIAEVGRALTATTAVDLNAGWFSAHEAVMASLAAAVVLPMACCAAIQAIYRQSASTLLRTFLVHLPLSLVLTGVAVALVRIALAVTDALSARVLSSAGVDTTNLFSGLSAFFAGVGPTAPAVPAFVVFIGGLCVAMAALVLWLELVVRAAAVSAAALFLPLALAALVWPAVAHWCRRLADTLVALILSKLVVAAVLSLAAGALAGGLGLSGGGADGGFSAVMIGIALLVIATLSPFTLLRLVPAVEAGAIAHLESTRHRLQGAARAPVRSGGNLALDLVRASGGSAVPDGVQAGTAGASGGSASGGGASAATSAIPVLAGIALGPEFSAVAGGARSAPGAGGHGAGPTSPTESAGRTGGGSGAEAGGAPDRVRPEGALDKVMNTNRDTNGDAHTDAGGRSG
jgi:hypothetical protein